MTQHPGPNDPDEGKDLNKGQPAGETEAEAGLPREQSTTPLGSTPDDPRASERASGPGPDQPDQNPSQPGASQGPYSEPTSTPQQGPGGGYGSSGYGYGQQQGGYSGQAHPGPGGQQSRQPHQQPYPPQQPPQHSVGPAQSQTPEGKNFFAALFDFSFQSFVAVKFAKFIYAILIAFLALGYLLVVIVAFTEGAAEGMVALLLGWIPAAIYLILIRISLEFMIALVRTSQNTAGTRTEIEALRSELRSRR